MTVRVFLFILCFAPCISKAEALYTFDTPQERARFEQLTQDLRCIECQGQSVAESYTKLANNIKQFTHQQITAGKSDEQIILFLTQRYGDAVYAKPPKQGITLWVWLAPLLFMFFLAFIAYKQQVKDQK